MGFKQSLSLSLPVAFALDIPFVMEFFTPGEPQLKFGPAPLPVEFQGNQREAATLDRTGQLIELVSIEEKLPCAFGICGSMGRSRKKRCDMAAQEPGGAVFDDGVAFLDLAPARSE